MVWELTPRSGYLSTGNLGREALKREAIAEIREGLRGSAAIVRCGLIPQAGEVLGARYPVAPRSGRSGRKSTARKPSPAITAPTVKAADSPAR